MNLAETSRPTGEDNDAHTTDGPVRFQLTLSSLVVNNDGNDGDKACVRFKSKFSGPGASRLSRERAAKRSLRLW